MASTIDRAVVVDYDKLIAWVRERASVLDRTPGLGGGLANAVQAITISAEVVLSIGADRADDTYQAGFGDAALDALFAIALVWEHHRDYGCWWSES